MKIAFLSFDSSMRSNVAIGRPLDLMVMPEDSSIPLLRQRIECEDAYFDDLSKRWSAMLSETVRSIPNPQLPLTADARQG